MNDYIKLDELSENGSFTVPTKENINMLKLREYCKINNIQYENLTEEEIKRFTINCAECDQINKLKIKLKEVRKENRKLKKEITEMLKYARYKEGEK